MALARRATASAVKAVDFELDLDAKFERPQDPLDPVGLKGWCGWCRWRMLVSVDGRRRSVFEPELTESRAGCAAILTAGLVAPGQSSWQSGSSKGASVPRTSRGR